MQMVYYFISFSLLIFLTITVINAATGPKLKVKHKLRYKPSVSILVPARNEQLNITKCLNSLQNLSYPVLEILVLDDESQDKTAAIVSHFAMRDSKIKLIGGQPLPPDWVGKNWACHQLSKHAKGDILIFTDADNWYHPQAVDRTIGWIQQYDLGMLSVFPQQITDTFAEKLIVPIIDFLLYTSLALWLTYYTRFASLAAANGQWIAFRRKTYFEVGGHKTVKDKIVEDVELSRITKRKGIKIMTLAGTSVVYGRMYHSLSEIWQGLTKNLFGLVSNKLFPFLLILLALCFLHIFPLVSFIFNPGNLILIVSIILIIIIRTVLAISYKHPLFISVLLHPFSILITVVIGLNSFLKIKLNQVVWKGRKISTTKESNR
jgi:chlorobactene glucosyltransferase